MRNQQSSASGSSSSSTSSSSTSSQSDSAKAGSAVSLEQLIVRFYSTIVKSQLNCPKQWKLFSILCIWVNFFQFSSIIVSFVNSAQTSSSLTSSDSSNNPSKIEWNQGWKLLIYLVRPEQYLYQEYNESNQRINIAAILLMFAFLGFQIAFFIASSQLITIKKHRKFGYSILSIFVNFTAFFNFTLCIPIHETLLLLLVNGSITSNSTSTTATTTTTTITSSSSDSSSSSQLSSSQELTNKICAVILLIFFQFYSYIGSKFYEVSYTVEERGIQRYCQDNLSIFLNHFRILSIVAYVMDRSNSNSGMVMVSVVSGVYFLAGIYEYFAKKPYSCLDKSENYIAALVLNFAFVACMVLDRQALLTTSSKTITFLLVLSPILLKFVLDISKNLNQQSLYGNLLDENEISSESDEALSRKIAMIANNSARILKFDQLKFFGIYEAHKVSCKRQMCFCKYSVSKCNEGTQFLLNSDILKRYVRYLIRTELVFSNLNEKIDRLIFFIRYMTSLSEQRKHSFAISKLIDFINESDRMRKSYGTFVRVCIDTMLNILKQIMFRNIVQIITDDEVEQQLTDIDLYIRMDMEKARLKDIVLKCIEKRIEIFEKMRKNFEDYTELESMNYQYNTYLDELESRFHLFYDRFPTRQNQCFYVFFQAEVKGNLKKAIQISNTRKFQSTSDAKKLFNVFEPNVLYLTATMGKIWGKIVNFSDKLPNALGYKKQEFNYVTHIKDIMPTSIATIHDDIIRCMMTQGNDTIINNQRQIFLRNKSNILIRVNVFITLNLYYTDELPFGVFVTPIETRSGFLFVTSAGQVEGLDQGILNQVGFNNVSNLPPYFQFKVQTCLPEFEAYAQIMANSNLTLFDKVDVPFNFFARSHPQFQKIFNCKNQTIQELMKMQSQSSMRNYSEQESSLRQSMKKMGSTQGVNQNVMKFKADITIERHRIRMLDSVYVYYIVEVKYLVRVTSNDEFYSFSNTNKTGGSGPGGLYQTQSLPKSQFGSKKLIANEDSFSQVETRDAGAAAAAAKNGGAKSKQSILDTNRILDSENRLFSESAAAPSSFNLQHVHHPPQTYEYQAIELQVPDNQGVSAAPTTTNRSRVSLQINNNTDRAIETGISDIHSEFNLHAVHMTERQAAALMHPQGDASNNAAQQIPISINRNHNSNSNDLSQHEFNFLNSLDTSAINQNLDQTSNQILSKDDHNNNHSNNYRNSPPQQPKKSDLSAFAHTKIEERQSESKTQLEQGQSQVIAVPTKNEVLAKDRVDYVKRSYTIGEKQNQDLRKLLQKDEREGSLASSTDTLNRSMDKYNYYEEFISSSSQPFRLRMVRYMRFMEFIILLIATIASIVTLYSSFDSLLQNIDTLTLHSNIMHPYANALTISNTRYQLLTSVSSATEIAIHEPIISTRQIKQFDLFDTMITQEWTNEYLTTYFTDRTIQIYEPTELLGYSQYITSNLLSTTSRILYALNHIKQYEKEECLNQLYTPTRVFLATNYSQLLGFFQKLVEETLADSIEYKGLLMQNILIITLILNVVTIIIFSISGWNYYVFSKNIMSILKMCETATTISVENEMHRFQKLQEELSENENMLFNYVFSIHQKEKELTFKHDSNTNHNTHNTQTHQMETQPQQAGPSGIHALNNVSAASNYQNSSINQSNVGSYGKSTGGKNSNTSNSNSNNKRKKLLVSVQHESLQIYNSLLFITICYALFVVFTITTYILNVNFLNNFEPAIKYYKTVSDSNFQIGSLTGIRALINEYSWLGATAAGKSSTQYKFTKTDELKSYFSSQLEALLTYNFDIFTFNRLNFFSDELKSQLDNVINSNVCSTSDDGLDNSWTSNQRCATIHKGILTQGLSNSISKHQGILSSYMELQYSETLSGENLFFNALDEAYVSITLTNYTLAMRNQIKSSLSSNTQSQKNLNLIISIVFISLASLMYIYQIFFGLKNVTHRFNMAKKIIFLVPLQTVMIEETFIKILKAQSSRLDIVK